jgi:death-on-curing protein
MISIEEVLKIHEILIEKFGGTPGVRDKELLESAVFRPFHTFDSIDLYPTPIDKAAAIIESIVRNHPFIKDKNDYKNKWTHTEIISKSIRQGS